MKNIRIDALDGFRVISIFIVMLYHFYSLYLGDLYDYNFNGKIFQFGYLGVEFFFMISGFVIFISLDNSKNWIDFIKKRYLRLMPGMLVCSVLTFSIYNIFDSPFYPQAKEIKNLLFSNTFITPSLPNKLFGTNFSYIDYSYWSLWIEVIFYTIISVLFFIDRSKVILNYSIISISSTLLWYFFGTDNVLNLAIYNPIHNILKLIPFIDFLIWFLIGIIISQLYKDKYNYRNILYLLFLFCLVFFTTKSIDIKLFLLVSIIIWIVFLYRNHWFDFLNGNMMMKLGRSSYSVYLIHQMIGVLVIIYLSPFFGNYNWLIPLGLIVAFFGFGLLSFEYLEKPISKILQKILLNKRV